MMNYLHNIGVEKTGKILFSIGLIYLIVDSIVGFTNFGLNCDEIFSLRMVQFSWDEMFALGISDVHPLLYYFIYKVIFSVASFFNFSNVIVVGKFVSLLPFYLLCIFNFTQIRKLFGWKTAGLFNLLIFSMPLLMEFSVEIRMYSWALLFMTIAFISVYKIIKGSNIDWIILTIMVVFASYTHYFAAIGSIGLYVVLFCYIIFRNRQLLKKYLISACCAILCYLPWVPFLLGQLSQVHEGYWISPLSVDGLRDIVLYVFSPGYLNFDFIPVILSVLLGLLLIIMSLIVVIKGNKDVFIKIGLLTFILVPLSGIIISFLDTPIYIYKYIIPVLGIFWLSISLILSKVENNNLFTLAVLFLLVIGLFNCACFIEQQTTDYENNLRYYDTFNRVVSEDDVVIVDRFFPEQVSLESYYLPKNEYYAFYDNSGESISNLIHNQTFLDNLNGSKVFLVSSYEMTDYTFKDNAGYFKIYEVYDGDNGV